MKSAEKAACVLGGFVLGLLLGKRLLGRQGKGLKKAIARLEAAAAETPPATAVE